MAERSCLSVPGVCCEAEARMVTAALRAVEGVEQVDVDILGRRAWVRHAAAVRPEGLLAALGPLDLGATLAPAAPSWSSSARAR